MPTQQEIFEKVAATLVAALNVEEEAVKPSSTLQGDLGADSIDFLDIAFRLEREFGVNIPRGELFPGRSSRATRSSSRTVASPRRDSTSCARACRSPT
jgi:acyl carrier protein